MQIVEELQVDYQVLRRPTFEELEVAVNAFINQGWDLVGGVAVSQAYSVYTDRDGDVRSSDEVIVAQAIRRAVPRT